MEGGFRKQTTKEEVTEDIPFNLVGREAVIVYKVKNALKYFKIELCANKMLKAPM
tara:strand:- start:88 stop:252 length:165 start_codon:yes stop_codon:yes gene_type:complete